jgi:hypothetical protein
MKTFKINEKEIELADKTYLDFYLDAEKGVLAKIDFSLFLESVQAGEIPIDENLKKYLEYLERWTTDAPRKRFNRKCRLDGMTVLTTDELFDKQPDGEQVIDDLENTGIFAKYLLEKLYS